jgi:KipI family sensor histidine kinase inhibitor
VLLDGEAVPPDSLLAMLDEPAPAGVREPGEMHEIPVRYGGDDGPDLTDVAAHRGLTEDDVAALHAGATYTVGFIGFSPGFPYLLGMPDTLATPRLATPRTRIPAGSVGIGGSYTGIYPQATAGGWRLIGRTDHVLFDAGRSPPAMLAAGATVRFVPA